MNGDFGAEASLTEATVEDPSVEATSSEYLGQWNRLVSTTNWEKGRIICQWRAALMEAGAQPGNATDEVWSRQVGNVTPQHVGRLRRVYQRFGHVREQYSGLYWSHFQAALDWPDAEMWLEGAVQNAWSISQMQLERAKTLSMVESPGATDPDLPAEMDEDAPRMAEADFPGAISACDAEVHDAVEDQGKSETNCADFAETDQEDPSESPDAIAGQSPPAAVRPLENLPPLPQDLADAFEAFKLAIIHHRLAGWQEVTCDDVLAALDGLRQLTMAPA